jgi:DNA-3-methyladenine glycosylase I
MADGVATGADGVMRCTWCGDDPVYVAYHDDEWGRPLRGDRNLFELLCLEGFQAGLAWITILRKREGFRAAFAGFDLEAIAAFGPRDLKRLLGDASIVRHRGKIEATIANAQATLALRDEGGGLDELVWSHAPARRRGRLRRLADVPTSTDESKALSKALQRAGFRFVGPTTVYAFMQSAGLVDDHLSGCSIEV